MSSSYISLDHLEIGKCYKFEYPSWEIRNRTRYFLLFKSDPSKFIVRDNTLLVETIMENDIILVLRKISGAAGCYKILYSDIACYTRNLDVDYFREIFDE